MLLTAENNGVWNTNVYWVHEKVDIIAAWIMEFSIEEFISFTLPNVAASDRSNSTESNASLLFKSSKVKSFIIAVIASVLPP